MVSDSDTAVKDEQVAPTTDAPSTEGKVTKVAKSDGKPKAKAGGNKAKAGGNKAKAVVKFDEGKERGKVLEVPIASITTYDNPRNEPENLYNLGYILLGDPSIEECDPEETDPAKFVSLVHLAMDPDYCYQYVELIEEYESVNRKEEPMADQSIVELAHDIQECGQLVPILLRKGPKGYVGIDGGRRIAAILYLHAKSLVMRAEKHEDAPKRVWPLSVLATTDPCKQGEVFLRSLMVNLSRKNFSPLQEGKVYHEMLQQINPATGKKWSMKDAAAELKVEYGTFRNREALWRPHDADTGRGLTDTQRQKVADGEMGVTQAARKALGESHYAETGKPSGKRNAGIPLKQMQKLFDESADGNIERRQALAECMGITIKQAVKESDARVAAAEKVELASAGRK
jgi:hypothetical protein